MLLFGAGVDTVMGADAAKHAVMKLEETAKAIEEVAANHEAVVTFAKAERSLERGELQNALQGFRTALNLGHPEPAECHSECGGILEELGRWSEAASEYGMALSLRPEHALYHASRGYALMQLDRLSAAAADFATAIALDSDDEDVQEQLRFVQTKVGEKRLSKLLDGANKERARRAGRRRPCTEELIGLETALPESAATVVREAGGLAVVAALVEDSGGIGLGTTIEASVSVIHQAIGAATLAASAASDAFATRSRRVNSGGANGAVELAEFEQDSGSRMRSSKATQEKNDPELQATLEKAREVERRIKERQTGRKNAEMTKYKEAAIAREREREAARGGKPFRPGVNEDMEALARLQRRAAEAMAVAATGALTLSTSTQLQPQSPESEVTASAGDVTESAKHEPEREGEENDWRSQLSDIGRSLVEQRFPLPSALENANLDHESTEVRDTPSAGVDENAASEVVSDSSTTRVSGAAPKLMNPLAVAAAAQAESVEALARELRTMIDAAPVERAVGEEEEEEGHDWRAALSDVGTSLLERARANDDKDGERPTHHVVPTAGNRALKSGANAAAHRCGRELDPQATSCSIELAQALIEAGALEQAEQVLVHARADATASDPYQAVSSSTKTRVGVEEVLMKSKPTNTGQQRPEEQQRQQMESLMQHLGYGSGGPASPAETRQHHRTVKAEFTNHHHQQQQQYRTTSKHGNDVGGAASGDESERARKARAKRQFYQKQARSLQQKNADAFGSSDFRTAKSQEAVSRGDAAQSTGSDAGSASACPRTKRELEAALELKHEEIEGLMSQGQLEAAKEIMMEAQALAAEL